MIGMIQPIIGKSLRERSNGKILVFGKEKENTRMKADGKKTVELLL